MGEAVDLLLILVLLGNFLMLGTSRVRVVIRAAGAQGIALGALSLLAHEEPTVRAAVLAAAVIGLKGIGIPALLLRAMRDEAIRREVEPFIGFVASLFLGGVATALSVVFAHTLPLAAPHAGLLLVPTSLATVLTGFLVLTTRRKAITQVVGYLTLENGIFVFGLLLLDALPLLVEAGVLLDVFVAVLVMGIILDHITREFASGSAEHLRSLRE
jgi:hydrogenase-4 component E